MRIIHSFHVLPAPPHSSNWNPNFGVDRSSILTWRIRRDRKKNQQQTSNPRDLSTRHIFHLPKENAANNQDAKTFSISQARAAKISSIKARNFLSRANFLRIARPLISIRLYLRLVAAARKQIERRSKSWEGANGKLIELLFNRRRRLLLYRGWFIMSGRVARGSKSVVVGDERLTSGEASAGCSRLKKSARI